MTNTVPLDPERSMERGISLMELAAVIIRARLLIIGMAVVAGIIGLSAGLRQRAHVSV